MQSKNKFLIISLSLMLAVVMLACSVSSLIPSSSSGSSSNSPEKIPGLAGTWRDPETTDTFVIAWENNQYVVKSVTWEGHSYSITSQGWDGSSLTWTYYDTDLPMTVTYATTSLSGDNLYVNWSYDDGSYGDETLGRVP